MIVAQCMFINETLKHLQDYLRMKQTRGKIKYDEQELLGNRKISLHFAYNPTKNMYPCEEKEQKIFTHAMFSMLESGVLFGVDGGSFNTSFMMCCAIQANMNGPKTTYNNSIPSNREEWSSKCNAINSTLDYVSRISSSGNA